MKIIVRLFLCALECAVTPGVGRDAVLQSIFRQLCLRKEFARPAQLAANNFSHSVVISLSSRLVHVQGDARCSK